MKNKIILIMTVFFCIKSYSQRAETSSYGAVYGVAEKGEGIQAFYNYGITESNNIQATIQYSKSEYQVRDLIIPVEYFALQANYMLRVLYARYTYNVHLGLGANLGQEVINNGQTNLSNGGVINSFSNFVYGLNGVFEADYYISNNWGIILKATQYYHKKSDLGDFTSFVGLGFKYLMF